MASIRSGNHRGSMLTGLPRAVAPQGSDARACNSPTESGEVRCGASTGAMLFSRSEEHTSELQSRPHLVCRLLLEKKKPLDAATLAIACHVVPPTDPAR